MKKIGNIKELITLLFNKAFNLLIYVGLAIVSFFICTMLLYCIRYPDSAAETSNTNKEIEKVITEYTELNENSDSLKVEIEELEKEEEDKNNEIPGLEEKVNSYN